VTFILISSLQGTIKILSQIGQDTAITEQQIKVVKAQMDKISKLKKVCLGLSIYNPLSSVKRIHITINDRSKT